MFFQFLGFKRAGWRLPIVLAGSAGIVLLALAAVLFIARVIFASGLFFGLFFIFFILPALVRLFFSFFLRFLMSFSVKRPKYGAGVDENEKKKDVIDVIYEVVK